MKTELPATNEFQNEKQLMAYLKSRGVDIESWGKGKAKTLEHLFQEIAEGETELTENDIGEMVRQVSIVNVDVFHKDADGQRWYLVEDRQVFSDGRERRREGIVGASLSEKIKGTEDPKSASARALSEELKIEINPQNVEELGVHTEELDSPSYPGLKTVYRVFAYRVVVGSSQFNQDGYVETQDDKQTFFVWRKVDQSKESQIAEAIVENLQQSGLNYVYILPSTGRYKGERHLTDFEVLRRLDCFYLKSDRDDDFL